MLKTQGIEIRSLKKSIKKGANQPITRLRTSRLKTLKSARTFFRRTRKLSKVISHPSYDERKLINDIALAKMDSPVNFDTVNYHITPACIPDGNEDYAGRSGYVTGFGTLFSGGSVSSKLRQVDVPVKSASFCENRFKYNNINSRTQVCAGESGLGRDTCQGDSGGPLVVKSQVDGRWHLVGLTSYGPNPCGEGGVYTRLSGFQNWIVSTMNANGV